MPSDFYLRRGAFPNLDGMRGIAVLLVLIHHLDPNLLGHNLVANGRFGVTVFFVLSGFLITSLLLRELADAGRVDGKRFMTKRLARVYPAYAAVLGLYVLAVMGLGFFSAQHQGLFVAKLVGLATFTANWSALATEGPFFVAWSLAVEMQFYVLVILVITTLGRRGVLGVAALLVVTRLIATLTLPPEAMPWWLQGVEESIWIGVLAAMALAWPRFRFLVDRWASPRLLLAVLCLLAAILAAKSIPNKHGLMAFGVALLSAAAILIAARSRRTPVLSSRLLEYLGRRSYGIYLTHMIMILLVRRLLSGPWAVLFALPLAVLAAEVLYRVVEKPGGPWLQEKLQSIIPGRGAPARCAERTSL